MLTELKEPATEPNFKKDKTLKDTFTNTTPTEIKKIKFKPSRREKDE
jgi:hypothetical protein